MCSAPYPVSIRMSRIPCLRASRTWCSSSGLPPTFTIGFGNLFDRGAFIGWPDVEPVERIARVFANPEHRFHQLRHMQVRLLLRSISEYFEIRRLPCELSEQIENDAVRGARPDYVGEAEN